MKYSNIKKLILEFVEYYGGDVSEIIQGLRDGDYVIQTETEAIEQVSDYIETNFNYFVSGFIADHTGIPVELVSLGQEHNVDLEFVDYVKDVSQMVDDAIYQDGLEHFLSGHDRNLWESGDLVGYRVN